jgi:SNF2 family DNA or RNA helicase
MPSLKFNEDKTMLELSLSGMPGPDFQRGLSIARSLSGRSYDGDKKAWVFPADPQQAEKVMLSVRPNANAEVTAWIRKAKAEKQAELITPIPNDADVRVPWADTLYDFQRAYVAWAAEHKRLILADDMGLGKSFQAISAIAEARINGDLPEGPKLVICPNSVKGVWARELRKWLGEDTPLKIIDAPTPAKRHAQIEEIIKRDGWVIVNYEQIRVKVEEYEKEHITTLPNGKTRKETRTAQRDVMKEPLFETTPWVAVIADEVHRCKSRKSLQTRGLWKIAPGPDKPEDVDVKHMPMKQALSGTPLMNSPDELWPVLHWLYPEEFGTSIRPTIKKGVVIKDGTPKLAYWPFFKRYVDHYEGYNNNKIVTGVKHPDELRTLLAKRLIRRTKGDKLNLPPKVREIIPVKLGPKQRKLYDEAEKKMWLEVEQAIKEGDKEAKAFAEAAARGVAVVNLPNGATRTVRQRQIASTPALLGADDNSAKLDAAAEIILDAQPKQFIVYSAFVGTCDVLVERLTKKGLTAKAFYGDVASDERTKLEDAFQAGEIDVLVGTIEAMGEGLTLTAADTAIFLERHWTPARNEQAEDRLWRNGQENRVTILIIEAEDTVDTSKVSPTNAVKKMIVSEVIQQDHVETTERERKEPA